MKLFLFIAGMVLVLFPFIWHFSKELRDTFVRGLIAFVYLTIEYWKEIFSDIFGDTSDEE